MTKPARDSLQRQRTRLALRFLAPMLIVLAVVAGWPLARTIGLSFTDAHLSRLGQSQWVALDNYFALAADPDWWRAVANTLTFTGISVSLELLAGLGVALVLRRAFPGSGFLQAAVLIPWAIPTVVSARIWAWMANDVYGVANDLLLRSGLIDAPVAWLADPVSAMGVVILADVWKATPFMALLLLAGLHSIPPVLYEAAHSDGAGPLRSFWHITLPLLRPAIAVAVLFRTLDALRMFDLVYVMLGDNRTTATVSVYARRQLIDFQEFGYGSAAAFAVFLLAAMGAAAIVTGLRVRLEPLS